MKYTIGIDIGGTKITGLLLAGRRPVRSLTVVTPRNLSAFKKKLFKLIDFLSDPSPYPSPRLLRAEGRSEFPQKSQSNFRGAPRVGGIGIGMAGLVDQKSGIVRTSPNIKYVKNLKLRQILKARFHAPVKIDNDANCFMRAEKILGRAKKVKNAVGVTLGTGIGGGLVIDGKLYRGAGNQGAELGHMVLKDEFLERAYQKLRDKKDFKGTGKVLGRAFVSLINIFAPDLIIIGGGYGVNESKKYFPAAKAEMKKFLLNKKAETKTAISKLKNAAALGAALLFAD